jgi:hypothetical protein
MSANAVLIAHKPFVYPTLGGDSWEQASTSLVRVQNAGQGAAWDVTAVVDFPTGHGGDPQRVAYSDPIILEAGATGDLRDPSEMGSGGPWEGARGVVTYRDTLSNKWATWFRLAGGPSGAVAHPFRIEIVNHHWIAPDDKPEPLPAPAG